MRKTLNQLTRLFIPMVIWCGPAGARVVDVKVTVAGYEPAQIKVAPNEPVTLRVTRVTDATCATELVIPDFNVKKDLPLNTPVEVDLGVPERGKHVFGCGMSLMISGTLTVGSVEQKKTRSTKPERPPLGLVRPRGHVR